MASQTSEIVTTNEAVSVSLGLRLGEAQKADGKARDAHLHVRRELLQQPRGGGMHVTHGALAAREADANCAVVQCRAQTVHHRQVLQRRRANR